MTRAHRSLSYKHLNPLLRQKKIPSESSSETKEDTALPDRFIRPRGLNATTTRTKLTITDPTSSSNGPSISTHPPQYVNLDLSTPPVVQNCVNGNGSPVIQDCSCSAEQLAAQAINDAITIVQAVKGLWNDVLYLPILEQFMGAAGYQSCQTSAASKWIDATLANLAKIQEYQWLPYDPRWQSLYSGNLSVYCATGVPPPQPDFAGECQQGGYFGWVYTSRSENVFSSFIGFCTSNLAQQNFISRAAMLEQVQAGQISLSDERLGLNYGRAAISLLAQLVPYINIQASEWGQEFGYTKVLAIAETYGCDTDLVVNSLTNADSWALWITTLYFTIQTKATPTSSLLPVVSANCEGHSPLCKSFVQSSDCQTAASRYDNDTMYSEYTSHWYNTEDYEGCTAIFQCAATYPVGGISGADIKGYFAEIYTSTADGGAGCGRCGSVYLDNGCEFTFNECDESLSCKTCNGNNCTRP